jgi:hypothetical protein
MAAVGLAAGMVVLLATATVAAGGAPAYGYATMAGNARYAKRSGMR